MTFVRWQHRPRLKRPVVIVAFEGWTDAGEAASLSARFLASAVGAEEFAIIDPEEFYDFTVARPTVRIDDDGERIIDWPTPRLSFAEVPSIGHDLVFLTGVEPGLKWRTFADEVLSVCRELGAESMFLVGSLLATVPHTRMPRITGYTTDELLIERFGFTRSRYEGPTGIMGVLSAAAAQAGLPCAGLWTSSPAYLRDTQSPKAALAMVERLADLLGLHLDTTELEIASAAYERNVNEYPESEGEAADYVRQLEEESDEDDPAAGHPAFPVGDTIAAEVERFLREQGR